MMRESVNGLLQQKINQSSGLNALSSKRLFQFNLHHSNALN